MNRIHYGHARSKALDGSEADQIRQCWDGDQIGCGAVLPVFLHKSLAVAKARDTLLRT